MECNARAAGRQWEWISHTEFILLFRPAYKANVTFLSLCICWDEEVIAVSTLWLPWRQRGFHTSFSHWPRLCMLSWHWSPLRALKLHSSAFHLAFHWIQSIDVWFEWQLCVSQASGWYTAARNSAALQQDIWPLPLAWVPVCFFCMAERRAWIQPIVDGLRLTASRHIEFLRETQKHASFLNKHK